MKRRNLRRVTGRENRRDASTHWTQEEGGYETGTLSAEPCTKDYRIRYYLSSEKLKAVD